MKIKLFPLDSPTSGNSPGLPLPISENDNNDWLVFGRAKEPFENIKDPQLSRKQLAMKLSNEILLAKCISSVNLSTLNDHSMEKDKDYQVNDGDIIYLLPGKKYGFKVSLEKDQIYNFDQNVMIDNESDISDSSSYSSSNISSESDYLGAPPSEETKDKEQLNSPCEKKNPVKKPQVKKTPVKKTNSLKRSRKAETNDNSSDTNNASVEIPKAWKAKSKGNFMALMLAEKLKDPFYMGRSENDIKKIIRREWDELDEEEKQSYYPKQQ